MKILRLFLLLLVTGLVPVRSAFAMEGNQPPGEERDVFVEAGIIPAQQMAAEHPQPIPIVAVPALIWACITDDPNMIHLEFMPYMNPGTPEAEQALQAFATMTYDDIQPIHYAAYYGKAEALETLLHYFKGNIDTRSLEGHNALHYAARKGHVACISVLKANNALIDALDPMGLTALQIAALRNQPKSMKALIKYGANKDVKRPDGQTLLHLMAQCDSTSCIKVWIKNGFSLMARSTSSRTALHIAAQLNKPQFMKKILKWNRRLRTQGDQRAEDDDELINARSASGCSPLFVAAEHGSLESLNFLLEQNAETDLCTTRGASALHVAVSGNHVFCLIALLMNGADTTIKDVDGSTPLTLARNRGTPGALCALILNKYANPDQKPAFDIDCFCGDAFGAEQDFVCTFIGNSVDTSACNHRVHLRCYSRLPDTTRCPWCRTCQTA